MDGIITGNNTVEPKSAVEVGILKDMCNRTSFGCGMANESDLERDSDYDFYEEEDEKEQN